MTNRIFFILDLVTVGMGDMIRIIAGLEVVVAETSQFLRISICHENSS